MRKNGLNEYGREYRPVLSAESADRRLDSKRRCFLDRITAGSSRQTRGIPLEPVDYACDCPAHLARHLWCRTESQSARRWPTTRRGSPWTDVADRFPANGRALPSAVARRPDDGFEYFRSWLIAKGQAVFEAALKDADALGKLITDDDRDAGCECEDLAYVAVQAWETRTSRGGAFPYDRAKPPSQPAGKAWREDEAELSARFPKRSGPFSAAPASLTWSAFPDCTSRCSRPLPAASPMPLHGAARA